MRNQVEAQEYPQKFLSKIIPFGLLLLAVCFLSWAAILTRLSEVEIGANATIFNRVWIATVFLGFCNQITNFVRGSPSEPNLNEENKAIDNLGILVLSAILDLSCVLLWAWSLNQTTVTNSTLLHNLTPIFAAIGAWLFLNQSFNSQFIIGLVLAFIGASAIAVSDFQFGSQYLVGDSLALLSAAFYGMAYVVYEKLRQKFSAVTLLFLNCLIRTILVFPLALITAPKLFPSSWSGWLTVIGLGVLCQGFGHLILIHSIKEFSAALVSIFLLLDPILTAILAWIIFAEQLNFINWIAFAVVLIGIYLARTSIAIGEI